MVMEYKMPTCTECSHDSLEYNLETERYECQYCGATFDGDYFD